MYRVVPFQCLLRTFPCGNMLRFTTASLEGCQSQKERQGLGIYMVEVNLHNQSGERGNAWIKTAFAILQ